MLVYLFKPDTFEYDGEFELPKCLVNENEYFEKGYSTTVKPIEYDVTTQYLIFEPSIEDIEYVRYKHVSHGKWTAKDIVLKDATYHNKSNGKQEIGILAKDRQNYTTITPLDINYLLGENQIFDDLTNQWRQIKKHGNFYNKNSGEYYCLIDCDNEDDFTTIPIPFVVNKGDVIKFDNVTNKWNIKYGIETIKESLKKEIKEYKDSCRFIKYKDSEDSTEYDIKIDDINQFISDNIDVAYAAKEEKLDCSFRFYDKKTGDLILNVKSNYGTLEQVVDGISLDAVKCFNLVKFSIQQKLLDRNWEECFKIIGNNNVKGEIDLFGIAKNEGEDINYEEAMKKLEELKNSYKSRFIPYLTINGKELVESCSLLS